MVDPIESSACDPAVSRLATGTIDLRYRKWDWGEGVAHYGLMRAAALLDSPLCLAEVRSFVHANKDFQPTEAVHVMPALASLLFYEETGDELGLELATRVVDMLRARPRSLHGAFIATPVCSAWVDYIYEVAPFLYHYDRVVGSSECREWATEQVAAYLMSCWNPYDGLFAHVYYDDIGATSQFYWARANGWCALGLIEVAQLAPEQWGLTSVVRRVFGRLTQSLEACQRVDGRWTTVLRDSRTYPETSATAMISQALRQGRRLGWVGDESLAAADRAWQAVTERIDASGRVAEVSAETPPGDADFYQSIPQGVYPWGQGFALLAALERAFGADFDGGWPEASR